MILGSLPFIVLFTGVTKPSWAFFHDQQVRGFCKVLLVTTGVMSAMLALHAASNTSMFEIIRRAAFNTISIVTTTGFATEDYTKWRSGVWGGLILSFLGGCSGSTTCGLKTYRLPIAWLMIQAFISRLISRRRVTMIVCNGRCSGLFHCHFSVRLFLNKPIPLSDPVSDRA